VDADGGEFGAFPARVTAGLARIGMALRHEAWQRAGQQGLTPTQVQVLMLAASRPNGLRLRQVAEELAVTAATASDAVSALERKRLVERRPAAEDRRGVTIALTADGQEAVDRAAAWPDLLMDTVQTLTADEQAALLRILVKMVRQLQESGRIPIGRMCTGCRFFQPHVYRDQLRPHHCGFVGQPFGDPELQIDCGDHQPVAEEDAAALWEQFVTLGGTP
jgi:DNA-binding MarR family transcriptional regulator